MTATWLGEHMGSQSLGVMANSDLYKIMKSAVTSKCPVSASSSQIEDHLSECILRLIRRDSLRNRIMMGKPITDSHLCTYAIRSAWTDARNSATNPICREMFGARTETERRKMRQEQAEGKESRRWQIQDSRVSLQRKSEDGVAMLMNIAVNNQDVIEDAIYFKSIWDRLLEEIKVGKPKVWDRYSQVLAVKLQGGGAHEVALEMGVSKSRATSMISETRRVIKEARANGAFASFGYS